MRALVFACVIAATTFAQSLPDGKQIEQQVPQTNPPTYTPRVDSVAPAIPVAPEVVAVVRKQFGPDFAISMNRTSSTWKYLHPTNDAWTPFLTADLNTDGSEDAIIVARNKKVMTGQGQYNYKVVDPYFTYHGFGDPKITSTLSSDDPDQGHVVLVIHGSGPEGWRADAPKAKFAIINLPFENLSISRDPKKRRPVLNLEARDTLTTAVVMWDGKKYRWKEW